VKNETYDRNDNEKKINYQIYRRQEIKVEGLKNMETEYIELRITTQEKEKLKLEAKKGNQL